jgi:hypothetical protein
MNQSNRKRQHFEQQQQKEEDNDNGSVDEVIFNREPEYNINSNDGNELSELKRRMAALEVLIVQ